MAIKQDQRKAFNSAIDTVEKTSKELFALYRTALKEATQQVADFKLKIDKGQLSPTEARADKRLKKLITEINDQIDKLYFVQGDIISSGWTENYVDTYYQISFAIEKEVNLVTLVEQGSTYDYGINYRKINPAYAKLQEFTVIGGLTFKDRQGVEKIIMQGKVRAIINNALVEGLTPKQVAKELQALDQVYATNLNKALATARTELLRAYSMSAQESWNIAEDRGVSGDKVWDATLDGRTRPAHARADQQVADKKGLFRVGGELTPYPRGPGLSAKNVVNCRCRAVYLPEGVKPNTRGFRSADGDWKQTYGDMSYQEWAKTLEGQATIEQTVIEKREAAKRAAKRREK
jgi:hypothetical protein